jgi:uncharacterized protein YidB (DUF937 family)
MALLPVVLAMLSNRRGGAGGQPGLPTGMGGGAQGGLSGLGGLAGLGRLAGLGGLAGSGGLGALLERFQQKGLGDQMQSWIGTGENQPLDPNAVSQVFDHDELSQIASQAGVSEDDARTGLSALLPGLVDQLTPDGQMPDDDRLSTRLGEFEQELGQRT